MVIQNLMKNASNFQKIVMLVVKALSEKKPASEAHTALKTGLFTQLEFTTEEQ